MGILLQEVERPDVEKSFNMIPCGNCFMYYNKIYFKIQEYKDYRLSKKDDVTFFEKINAVCISESCLAYFTELAMVTPIEAELNYYK